MITLLARLLKILNSDDSPPQIALAVVLAAFLGLTPLVSPHNLCILLVVCVIRVNLSMFLLSFALFTLVAYLLDPLSHLLGLAILQAGGLSPLWNALYQYPFWRFMAYNNTLIMGSFSVCLLISAPLFFITTWLVNNYREHLLKWVSQTRLMMWLKGSRFYNAYLLLKN